MIRSLTAGCPCLGLGPGENIGRAASILKGHVSVLLVKLGCGSGILALSYRAPTDCTWYEIYAAFEL